jgi:ATP-binding cassette subfamily B protein
MGRDDSMDRNAAQGAETPATAKAPGRRAEAPGRRAEVPGGPPTGAAGRPGRPSASAAGAGSAPARPPMGRRGRGPMRGGGPMGGMMVKDKPKDFKGSLLKLLRYLSSYRLALVIVILFAIISTVFSIAGPKILGNATTELFKGIMGQVSGSGTGPDFGAIANTLLLLLGLYGISAVFQLVQGLVMANISNSVSFKLRRDIDAKIMRLPFSYYDKVDTGDVMSRITNDVDAINQSLSQSVTQIITSLATLIGVLVMMFSISWLMTLIALLTLPLSLGLIGLIVGRSQKHFVTQQKYLGRVNGLVEENYGAHVVLRAFNGEAAALKDFEESNDTLYASAWKANFLSGLMMPLMNFVGNLGYVVICATGGYLAVQGRIELGDIQAFVQYMRNFQQPIMQVAQISSILQQTMAAAERVFTFLDEEEESADVPDEKAADAATAANTVSFDHVRFGYSADKVVINDFSASVSSGQKIAIVGPTGAGKTTIVKLLMRFYDVGSGAILVGGRDIREYRRDDLRNMFGMVLQDTWLYSASIVDNIRYGRLDATDEEIQAAARVAQADHFISTLPDGYGMVINEEVSNISQGQKQLLTIARAVLHDPKVLILDEATSSVDTRTELLIQKAMDNLMAGRTSFIIAHRLSTIRNADLILVMDKGDIVEQGTHDGLLAQNGFYATLYNSQFDVEEE